jgi:hypothetical protein
MLSLAGVPEGAAASLIEVLTPSVISPILTRSPSFKATKGVSLSVWLSWSGSRDRWPMLLSLTNVPFLLPKSRTQTFGGSMSNRQ